MSSSLPHFYMITGKFEDQSDFANKLKRALEEGDRVVQLRCKNIDNPDEYLALANIATEICKRFGATLLLATSVDIFSHADADGLHLTSQSLHQYENRPVPADKLLSVSCHTEEDMMLAKKLGADILLLSPVKETSSHPGVPGIGWEKFAEMAARVGKPVYALGGMQASDLDDAIEAGGQGVAAISSFWK